MKEHLAKSQSTANIVELESRLTALEAKFVPKEADPNVPGWMGKDQFADLVLPDFVTRADGGGPYHAVSRGMARIPESWSTVCGWRFARTGFLTNAWTGGSPCELCLSLAPDRFPQGL